MHNQCRMVQKLEKLIGKSQYILQKLSFVTILNRMISKKMKMKNFISKQENTLKRKLFNLFLTHKTMMNESKLRAVDCFKSVVKKEFLTKLKDIQKEKYHFE